MIRNLPLAIAFVAVLGSPLSGQTGRAARVAADVRYLASDALAGRKTGEPGNDSAAAYLARRMREIGLRPGGDSGGYFQRFTVGSSSGTRAAGVDGRASANVVGILPGSGALRGQAIIIGAHFDHLGTGGSGSLAPDSVAVHNGADDNASGSAAVLEVARQLAQARRTRMARNDRAIVFVLFSGEEQGLIGSAWHADHPVMPMDSTLAMINFDMVGRMRNGRLIVLGARSATEWPALVDSVNANVGLDIRASGDGWGPSDQSSFYAKRRPVLHLFTDLHENYHRPSDDAERIDAAGIVRAADLATALAQRLAVREAALTFVDAPPPAPVAAGTGSRPVLGTIPDMTDEPGGVRLSGVRAGSPAETAGLRGGDVLTGIGAHAIANLQDFQNALMAHRPGEVVELRFLRAGQAMSATVTLGGSRPAN